MCYTERISCSKHANDYHRIHFRYSRYGQSVMVLFQDNGVAALILSERSPVLPALSAKDLPGGQTEVSNVH